MDNDQLRNQQNQMVQDFDSVRSTLLRIPNVVAVGIGFKESAGTFTKEMSYRVFVTKKKPEAVLQEGEVVPATFNGIKTDVLNPLKIVDCSNVCGTERRTTVVTRPIKAGLAISTSSDSYGTLGWFGKLDADDTPILLTNKHVLYDSTNAIDLRKLKVAQSYLGEVTKCCCCECGSDDTIGEAIIGIRDISPASDTSVDCAIAKINPDIAAAMKLEISNASTTEVIKVKGTEAAQIGDTVRKIGARSGFTEGVVVHLGDLATAAATDSEGDTIIIRQGQVLIIPADSETYEVMEIEDGDCNKPVEGTCKKAFANCGDSGSVLINANDKITALIWGVDFSTNSVAITIANNISSVLSKLGSNGFPITLSVSPDGGANDLISNELVVPKPQPKHDNLWQAMRDANKESVLHKIIEMHYKEVMGLVNNNRAVTVVWQRNQGPAFVAAINRASRVESFKIPSEINGVSIQTLLDKMEDILMEHGSMSLRETLKSHSNTIKNALVGKCTVEEIVQYFFDINFLDNVPYQLIANHKILF